jgi:hypothetical protein
VKRLLEQRGVAPERLQAVGYGSSRPERRAGVHALNDRISRRRGRVGRHRRRHAALAFHGRKPRSAPAPGVLVLAEDGRPRRIHLVRYRPDRVEE